jgi:Family of unknown function (DUF6529)
MGVLLDVNGTYTDVVTSVFSSTIAMKVWFATAAIVLVVVQVSTATRMWGHLEGVIRLPFPVVKGIHRWSGRIAFLLTLPVFFHCVFILGFQTPNARVAVHSIVGSFVYGVFAAKILVLRTKGYPHWVLPVVGGAVAALLIGLWFTSAYWYFTTVRFGF